MEAQLRELHLPTLPVELRGVGRQAEAETLSYERYLLNLSDQECQERRRRKIERLLRQSWLPLEKNLETFDLKRLPTKVARQVQSLREGDFVDRQENLLAFGKPGSGKTHLFVRVGPGTGAPGAAGSLHDVQPAGAGVAGGETRPEAEPAAEAFGELRGFTDRRSGLCAAEPRGDGGAVHAAGGALRAGQRVADEQPAVLEVGERSSRTR